MTVRMFQFCSFLLIFTLTYVEFTSACSKRVGCRKKSAKPENCPSGELAIRGRKYQCGCPSIKRCAWAEGETCYESRFSNCASGLECLGPLGARTCQKKNDCEVIKRKIARKEEILKALLQTASIHVQDLANLKKENKKCFACSNPKHEY